MSNNCKHPTCYDSPECRREKKASKTEQLSLIVKAQSAFNRYIRLRDKDKPCICGCGEKVEHAGHYFPLNYSGVRFNEMNVNGQAKNCNFFGSSAIDPNYEAGLIDRYGMGATSDLIIKAESTKFKKWSRQELQEIIDIYNKKIKA
jgi:hypothetical protein